MRFRNVVFWAFDDEGRAVGEDSYTAIDPDDFDPIDPSELPDSLRRLPGADRAADGSAHVSTPFDYTGKRVVVTGGATGVGAALLDVLAELDAAHVTVLDLKSPTGAHDEFLETDLSDRDAIDAAVAR